MNRRRFLSGLAAAASLPFTRSATSAGGGLRRAASTLGSAPIPALRWRGESAFSMGLSQGTIGVRERSRVPGATDTDDVAVPRIDLEAAGADLRRRYPDLRQHFLFEYYPWYATHPW